MQDSAKTSSAAPAIAACFGVLALLFWVLALATLPELASSDAAGNGYAQAYAAIELFILWGLLALVTLIACVKGEVAWPAAITALPPISRRSSGSFRAISAPPHQVEPARAGGQEQQPQQDAGLAAAVDDRDDE